MSIHFKPRRATCIVECENGILLAETESGMLLLPGGQAHRGESRLEAAIRELKEETNLQAHAAIYLFDHESHSNRHKVFYLITTGNPIPMQGASTLCSLINQRTIEHDNRHSNLLSSVYFVGLAHRIHSA